MLPALAARILGTPVTVVTGEGRPQMFLPHGADPATADPASGPVLFAAAASSPPPLTPTPTPPWLPPTVATGHPALPPGPRRRPHRPRRRDLHPGHSCGPGQRLLRRAFHGLRLAAEQPGRDSRVAARLRTRAGASPAQLMRLNGLPGERAKRDTLFSPPAPGERKGAPALRQDASTAGCAATWPTPRGARTPTVRWPSGRQRRPAPRSS
ncbi:hypothetical protein LUR56_00545 [Streptomyces sp. MT29]|nr:hypothetical protein [Streptomyces sp. MT29]